MASQNYQNIMNLIHLDLLSNQYNFLFIPVFYTDNPLFIIATTEFEMQFRKKSTHGNIYEPEKHSSNRLCR